MKWDGLNWIHLALLSEDWRALANAVMNLGVPSNAGKFLTSWATSVSEGVGFIHW